MPNITKNTYTFEIISFFWLFVLKYVAFIFYLYNSRWQGFNDKLIFSKWLLVVMSILVYKMIPIPRILKYLSTSIIFNIDMNFYKFNVLSRTFQGWLDTKIFSRIHFLHSHFHFFVKCRWSLWRKWECSIKLLR